MRPRSGLQSFRACEFRQNCSTASSLHRGASCDESSRNGTGEITMQPVIHALQSFYDSLLNSPHHLWAYVAIAGALLVCIPLSRAVFRSRRRNAETPSSNIAYPSMLGLSSPPTSPLTAPSSGSRPAVREFTTPTVSKVTAINQSLTAPCIHCGVTMSSRQDFCPACGYAQPVKQGLKAAFPA